MRKISLILVILVAIVFLAGCIKTKTVIIERVDQEPGGNRGYLCGNAPESAGEKAARTREVMQVEIELPSYCGREQRLKTEDSDLYGNRGNFSEAGTVSGERDVSGSPKEPKQGWKKYTK